MSGYLFFYRAKCSDSLVRKHAAVRVGIRRETRGVRVELLKERILKDGRVIGNDLLKVDSFINHQIDVDLLQKIGEEFFHRFDGRGINKIMTVEASGIGIACMTAQYFSVPVVFAKKGNARNIGDDLYQAEVYSFTKGQTYTVAVSKSYLGPRDTVLIVDDFLANGQAALGLVDILSQAGASLAGVGIVIEKGFQKGSRLLRERGIEVQSLAIVDGFCDGKVILR